MDSGHRSFLFAFLPLLAATTLLGLVPQATRAQEGLTLDEAIAIARANNPGVRIARNDGVVYDWDVRSSVGSLFPVASINSGVSWQGSGEQRIGSLTTGQLGFGGQPSYYFSNYGIALSYTLSGSTLRAPARARAARSAGEARTRDVVAQIVFEVTLAYLDLLRQHEGVILAQSQLERANGNLRLARGRQAAGSATLLDVRQAEVQVGREEVALLQAELGVRTARLVLLQRMGVDLDREVIPTTRFEVAEIEWNEEELFELALSRNAALQSLRANQSVAAVDVQVARSGYFPTLSMQAGLSGFTRQASQSDFLLSQADRQAEQMVTQCEFQNEIFRRLAEPLPPQNCSDFLLTEEQRHGVLEQNRAFPFNFTRQPASVSLSVSLPIFQGLGRQRDLEAARVQEENATERLRERELATRTEIASLLAAIETAYQSSLIEVRNREVAADQIHLAREQFGVGLATFLQLVEAEALKAQADRDHLESIFRFHEAIAQLELLTGGGLSGEGGWEE